ncbi:MAG: 4-hydroxythreonine-4-phosphate dehydrogenase PdxA [Acidobacteria bacterium]|nr:4-hydroxythreonine-4-phosphate dehydrogenase PdxA [Acidobacteriota bacterium]
MRTRPVIAITPGDPSGIGPEIVLKALPEIKKWCRPVVFSSRQLLEQAGTCRISGLEDVEFCEPEFAWAQCPGKLSSENGRYAAEAIRLAVSRCMDGRCDALVTAPISKKAWELAGIDYPGHTEMLRDLAGVKKTMMLFYAPAFSVILHTIHIPLAAVPAFVTEDRVAEALRFAVGSYGNLVQKPFETRVCGLNPHAGEQGRLGTEDFQIRDAVLKLAAEGMNIRGPFPADTLFARLPRDGSVLVYAMYHDQGLAPIKTLYPDKCVNITLGLPFIRASVNHGTAFDIAGKGLADFQNLLETVRTTVRFLNGRQL